jgi:tetratricopeptide (TPR) repeat protein
MLRYPHFKKYLLLSSLACLCFSHIHPAIADDHESTDEQETVDTSNWPSSGSEGVTSIEAFQIGPQTANSLSRGAEYCVHNEQYDKAIKLSKMAIDKNLDDNEIHQIYAQALEGKLSEQVERDPSIFNECVKQWLIVLRQEYGDEKLSYHGLSIPGMGKFYEDEDRVIEARKHLVKLTGGAPKVWETDAKWLKKVLVPSNTSVYGKVMPGEKSEEISSPQ